MDELKYNKMFLYYPASLLEFNMEAMLNESLKEYLKIETRLYQVHVVFPLMRVRDDVVSLKKLSQRKRESRCMIIKLVNVHARAQYLYKKNQKGNQWGGLLKLCRTRIHTLNRV